MEIDKDFLIREMGISIVAGLATGYAVKQLGKIFLLVGGVAFMGLQYVRHQGLLEVDMKQLGEKMTKAGDVNADGKLIGQDVQDYGKKVMEYFGV